MYDVVTLGETMLRFTPPGCERLERPHHLDVHVGGSESNTAVGLQRLGLKTCWLSRLTANPLGRTISSTIASHGVDVTNVVWTPNDRVGLYFLEQGSPPRGSQVIYDRAGSAFSQFDANELPEALFTAGSVRCLHVTGISLALGETTRRLIHRAVELARLAGALISFDLNYRQLLWSPDEAKSHCQELVETADIVFLPRRDAVRVWGSNDSDSDAALIEDFARCRRGHSTVMTLSDRGAIAIHNGKTVFRAAQSVEPIGRLGGGDAFSAGYLYGWLQYQSVESALRWGVATAMIKYSIPGDLPIIDRSEVEQLAQKDDAARTTGQSIVR